MAERSDEKQVQLSDCRPGDRIRVWGFEDREGMGPAGLKEGTVKQIETTTDYLSVTIKFTDRKKPVYARSYAKTYLVTSTEQVTVTEDELNPTDAASLGHALDNAYGDSHEADRRVQELAVAYARALALEAWPDAHCLILTSSDQSYDYGWVLTDVGLADGSTMDTRVLEDDDPGSHEDNEPEDLWRPLSDIGWRNPAIDQREADRGGNGARLWLKDEYKPADKEG